MDANSEFIANTKHQYRYTDSLIFNIRAQVTKQKIDYSRDSKPAIIMPMHVVSMEDED